MKALSKKFKDEGGKISFSTFFQFLEFELNLKVTKLEQSELENRLGNSGSEFIEFSHFNEFCKEFDFEIQESEEDKNSEKKSKDS